MYAKLQHVIKIVLILSHGQAQVEQRFSSNKSLSDDNISLIPLWLYVQVPWPKGSWSWNDKRCISKMHACKKEIFWRSIIKSPICWENRESGSKKQSQWRYWNSQYWNPTDAICDWESKEEFWWNWISCWEKDSLRLVSWYCVIFNSFSDIKPFN